MAALETRTSLGERQLRRSLAILVQNMLVYWCGRQKKELPAYEANVRAVYGLLRYGKWIKIAEDRYGSLAGQIVSSLLLLGHGKIADLVQFMSFDNVSGAS